MRPMAGSILALYPLDEPPHCWPPTGAYAAMVKTIKAVTPELPIVAVLNPSFALGLGSNAYSLPPEVDWVGFDEYGCWNQSAATGGGPACYKGVSYPEKLHGVDDYVKKHGKKLVVVPNAHYGQGW